LPSPAFGSTGSTRTALPHSEIIPRATHATIIHAPVVSLITDHSFLLSANLPTGGNAFQKTTSAETQPA
jgi:hypothetical protein